MSGLTNEELFAIPFRREAVAVQGANGEEATILVRELSEAESEALGAVLYPVDEASGKVGFNANLHDARWVVACAINEDGSRRFADDELERVASLPRGIVSRLADAARKINRADGDQPAADAAKN